MWVDLEPSAYPRLVESLFTPQGDYAAEQRNARVEGTPGSLPNPPGPPVSSKMATTTYVNVGSVGDDIEDEKENSKEDVGSGFVRLCRHIAWRERGLIAFCGLVDFLAYASFSITALFFPAAALRKGVSETVMGLIFGAFSFISFILGPFVGEFVRSSPTSHYMFKPLGE
ncbi:unnamed protein product [Darwinula stevensoni]|uniref:Uncharacterized protein n=1 Tax=Darwinula stevensoni TaxID=69355 RepID=A0A7R8X2D6_9CRUS|nr:unnamed protein product [Darwinula stevensoni]CAG0883263.1 unnamed protein product [Darwinula stevensoni]